MRTRGILNLRYQEESVKSHNKQTGERSGKPVLPGAGSKQDDHLLGERAGDGGGAAEPPAAVARLAGLQVALVVFVEFDLTGGGDFDPLFDTLVGFELWHGSASYGSPKR